MRRVAVLISIAGLMACSAEPQVDASTPHAPEPAVIPEPPAPPESHRPLPMPEADITTVITCTGATLKMGDKGLWDRWIAEASRRVAVAYPKKSPQQVEAYALERALDKRRSLEGEGLSSPRAFTEYYNKNCLGIID